MSKVAIIYWSGTGNTEAMAKAILRGAEKNAEATLFEVEQFSVDEMKNYDGFIFGCPAMGAEELEEGSFEPFFAEAEKYLKGVPVALFGSYGWGGGEWMKTWYERTRSDRAKMFSEGLIIENEPTDEGIIECQKLGEKFAASL